MKSYFTDMLSPNYSNSTSTQKSKDKPTGAEQVRWDLTDMFATEEALLKTLTDSLEQAKAFSKQYKGRLNVLQDNEYPVAMNQLGSIQDSVGKAYTYAYLNWSTDTAAAHRGALLQKVKEAYTEISTNLLFFDLEWTELKEGKMRTILSRPDMSAFSHYLEVLSLNKKHLLSEPEERIMVEKHNTGRSAWNRFFDETLGDLTFDFEGEKLTQQQILAKLHDSDRAVRREAAEAFTSGLKSSIRPLTFVFNTILADKALDDRLRGYPNWISSRNQSNEVADQDVEALIAAVQAGYGHVGRFYEIKRQLLEIDEMTEYDRYAPIGEADRFIPWETAKKMVLDSYTAFHPQMGEIASMFFERNWIDAALAPAKRGGAFSHGAVPSTHPYILVNYTGKIRDVQTLAHELGHGIHQYLSRKQGIFHADTPLTTAETASVFGEMLVFQRLMSEEKDDANRLAMLMGKIDDTIATVFRQVSMNRFEDRIHTLRRERGELSSEDLSAAWMETQKPMFDGSVQLSENYQWWWSYIPHFLHTPGYVYAYAFGELLVLALHAKYQVEGDAFASDYLELLSSGGSDWPHVLVGKLGVDLRDPDFWAQGVASIGKLVDQAEALMLKTKA